MDRADPAANSLIRNPILPGLGVCDPHVRVFRNRAYLFATRDRSRENTGYAMDEWWVWSSADLVNWRHESTLRPEETYLGSSFDGCWATDAAERNGRYYWYFSERNIQTGVMVADNPAGPWSDPLGRPMIGSGTVPVGAYDPGVFTDSDGTGYILFGVWEFYISRLEEDMITLAEQPKRLEVISPAGPYGPGKTDDKPFLHKRGSLYYLSWGCFYGISERVYGPYRCMGSIITPEGVHPTMKYRDWPVTLDRHGSFFQWGKQWFFICNDFSGSGNPYFRDSVICPVEYGHGGEIRQVRINPVVGIQQRQIVGGES